MKLAEMTWPEMARVAGRIVPGGSLDDAIAEAAQEDDVDIIVMATSGKSGILRTILGSVADEVLRESGKPVLMLRPEDSKKE